MTTDRQFDDEADAMFVDKAREAMRPVVEDARAEAERRYPSPGDYSSTAERAAFAAGAEWAASRAVPSDHTATTEDAASVADRAAAVAGRVLSRAGWVSGEDIARAFADEGLLATARPDTTTEPTDAQVLAALNAMHPKAAAPSLDYWGDKSANEMRAALRAAWTEADQ